MALGGGGWTLVVQNLTVDTTLGHPLQDIAQLWFAVGTSIGFRPLLLLW